MKERGPTTTFDPLKPNQQVQLSADPGRRGITTGKTKHHGTRTFVQVEFGPQERTFIDSEDIEPVTLNEQDVGDLLTNLRFGKKGELARILTFHKISSRLANVFYSMQTSRTDFYAYQFKPVYKFIESANGRILIADEVGLGKTIEAGLIWQEVKARTGANKLLVVCPSMLRPKWRKELRTRFNLQAEIYDSKGFLTLLEDFEYKGSNFQCAAVCSVESLRQAKVLDAIEEFSKADYRFDLVVIDEAHYLRNSDTRTHQMGQRVSGITEHLVMLTATPIHLKNEDLYRLLSVLDHDEYSNLDLFEKRVSANAPVVAAQNALRRIPADIGAAREHINSLAKSPWFNKNPLTEIAISRIAEVNASNHSQLVEVSRLLENLNLLSATVSRTRKREVQEWRVVREARVLDLEFYPHEMDFYRAVTEAVRKRVSLWGNGSFESFMLMMPQRQMASCIPAMVEHYRATGDFDELEIEEMLEEDLGWDNEDEGEAEKSASTLGPDLKSIIASWQFSYPDSKYEVLVKELKRLFQIEPQVKIVLFSYFRRTLAYLERRLAKDGYSVAVIHGGIAMEERQEVITKFSKHPEQRILLSSEVGAEGLDLQFCRIVINYDLPWNPMKVEQRIGRIDRLGQDASKVTIVNIAARETIEAKILDRLYRRIGIFERSIGDLEPILGDMIQKLTLDLLSAELTPQQEETRIEQTRLALEEKRRQERDLEDNSSLFFGSSDFILEQISGARKTGRWVTPAELRSYITDFFHHNYVGTRTAWDRPEEGLVSISLSHDARFDLTWFCKHQNDANTRLTHTGSDPLVLGYTNEAVGRHQDVEFLSHFHPLIRWITDSYKSQPSPFFRTSAVEVKSDIVPPGDYVFLIEFWRFIAVQHELQIAYALAPLNGGPTVDAISAELLLQEILAHGQNWAYADRVLGGTSIEASLSVCNTDLANRREAAYEIFKRKTVAAAQRKSAQLESHLARKEESFKQSLRRLQHRLDLEGDIKEQRVKIERQMKGDRTKFENVRQKVSDQLKELEKSSKSRFEIEEIAGGACRVSE
jgi:superfamily II DNA or RNA helicase